MTEVNEGHLSWLLGFMPNAKAPDAYGPGFGEDIQFSPILSSEDDVRAVGKTLEKFGRFALGCYFGLMAPGRYQLHVVFSPEHAGEACAHYRRQPVAAATRKPRAPSRDQVPPRAKPKPPKKGPLSPSAAVGLPCLRALLEMTDRGQDLGRIARIMARKPIPTIAALDQSMASWGDRIARTAPPHVLWGSVSQAVMTSDQVYIELPQADGGTGVFAERLADGSVAVSRIEADDEDVWLRGMLANLRLPTLRPEFVWKTADEPSWEEDQAADDRWSAWAKEHVRFRYREGEQRMDADVVEKLVWSVLIPDLVTLASLASPTAALQDLLSTGPDSAVPMAEPGSV